MGFKSLALAFYCCAMTFLGRPSVYAEGHDRYINVDGKAEITVQPDYAVLDFAVETQHKQLIEAKRENDEIVRKVLKVLQESKVDEKDYRTDYVRIWPRLLYDKDLSTRYYQIEKGFKVVVRDLEHFESLFTDLVEAGANEVNKVVFRTTRQNTLRAQTREKAIMAAREKAIEMAKVLGQRIGEPTSINEYDSYDYESEDSGSGMMAMMAQGGGSLRHEPTFAFGHIRVSASVSVSFELLSEKDK